MAAPVFDKQFIQDLAQPVNVRHCGGLMFTGDAKADTIAVTVTKDGETYALTGTVSLNCIRADGATVTVTGSISGNVAQATLAQACCAIQGPLAVVMKVTSGDVTSTILKAVYTVDIGQTGVTVDPGTIIPDVNALIASIEAAVESIPADYSDLLAAIAPTYSNASTYAVGDYVWYDGDLYRCTTAISTAESWTAAHWELAVLSEDVDEGFAELKSAFVTEDGLNKVKAENLQIVDAVFSPNLIDETKIANGGVYKNGNPVTGDYKHTDYIPVEAGEKYYFTWKAGSTSTTRSDGNIRFLACYDSSKTVMESSGSNDNITSFPYTIPEGVAFVILSFSSNSYYSQYQFEQGEAPTAYHTYGIISASVDADYLPIDTTLTESGKLADAKAVGDRIDAMEGQIEGFVPVDGIDQVTPQNLQIMDTVFSPNLYNPATVTDGIFLTPSTGAQNTNSSYLTTDYIPVEAGEKYYGTWQLGSNESNRGDMTYQGITCYNASKEVMGSVGSTSVTNPYTVPAGVSFIRISQTNNTYYKNREFDKSETATPYVPYGSVVSSKVKSQYLDNSEVETARGTYQTLDARLDAMEGQIEELTPTDETCFNEFDFSTWTDGYIKSDGTPAGSDPATISSIYATSDFTPAEKGDVFVFSAQGQTQYNSTVVQIGYFAEYDSSKTLLRYTDSNQAAAPVLNASTAYVRMSVRIATYGTTLKQEKNAYGLFTSYMDNTVYKGLVKPSHVFIPHYIFAAVGRTIEIYNDQIVLDNANYHIQYICTVGTAMKRKFTLTATATMASGRSDSSLAYGQYRLYINIYNNDNQLVWQGCSLIWVKAALNSAKTVIPIGDSLTNWKKWLPECIHLSNNNLTFVGTRYSGADQDSDGNSYASGTIHHEGRSGWSAASYLANTSYTFDERYDGVEGVSGSANPFWDGTKFSLEHYLTTQEKNTPTAVQIWLGTNDIAAGIDAAVTNIVSMVESIHAEYGSLKILVCNTIYRSNQDGYGSIGSDGYAGGGSGALAYAYNENIKVMDLANKLTMALNGMENVYVVPLYCSHDSEYNFGWNEYHPNPRAEQIVHIPDESVHPATQGYWQLADILFSAYSALL